MPANLHILERRILASFRERDLLRPGQRGLISVSGGADSMALLHLLHALRGRLDLRLEVLHFDHGLRAESSREAEWVADQGRKLDLPVHILRAEHLSALKSGVQAAARAWRRTESNRLLLQWEANWIATGHHRGDNMETLLLKWLRGAHLTHLQGMNWRSGAFIRPLLSVERETLEAYLRDQGLEWLEDPSNREPKYKRNRVRHELLPLLEELSGGGIARRLEDLAAQSAQLDAWCGETLADHPVPRNNPAWTPHWIAVEGILGLPLPVRGAALVRFVEERLPGALSHSQVQRVLGLIARGAPAWSLHIGGKRQLRRLGERIVLEETLATPSREELVSHRIAGREIRAPAGWEVREAPSDGADGADGLTLHNLPPAAALEIRPKQPGDRFHPSWKDHSVKVKDFLRDQKVPLWQRDRLPLVIYEGRVIAIHPRFVVREHGQPTEHHPPLRLLIFSGWMDPDPEIPPTE